MQVAPDVVTVRQLLRFWEGHPHILTNGMTPYPKPQLLPMGCVQEFIVLQQQMQMAVQQTSVLQCQIPEGVHLSYQQQPQM